MAQSPTPEYLTSQIISFLENKDFVHELCPNCTELLLSLCQKCLVFHCSVEDILEKKVDPVDLAAKYVGYLGTLLDEDPLRQGGTGTLSTQWEGFQVMMAQTIGIINDLQLAEVYLRQLETCK